MKLNGNKDNLFNKNIINIKINNIMNKNYLIFDNYQYELNNNNLCFVSYLSDIFNIFFPFIIIICILFLLIYLTNININIF